MSRTEALLAGAIALATGAAALAGPVTVSAALPSQTAARTTRPVPAVAGRLAVDRMVQATPPTTAQCQKQIGISCYNPVQYAQAYDLHRAWDAGITGRGRTIVIVDAFGSPTIQNDLTVFDRTFGLPDPPSLQVLAPVGKIPAYDNSPGRQGWAFETTLDVEYAHAVAPEAKIVLLTTPVAETEGVTGFPEIVAAENWAIDRGLGDVISQSFGATEQTFPSRKALLDLRSSFLNARRHGVTVLASSGDTGVTNYTADGSRLYPYPANSWPSSDPLVTSVGGTQLHLDAAGNRTAPDQVWNDGYGAGGGGKSTVFARPVFQDAVRSVVGDSRGTPDISLSAAVDGAAILYLSFIPGKVGFHLVGGTSEAAPLLAGVVALAAQAHGGRLGDINPALYQLGTSTLRTGIVDVTKGDISFGGVSGPPATRGYDLASGWGTVDAGVFATALAQQTSQPLAQQQAVIDR